MSSYSSLSHPSRISDVTRGRRRNAAVRLASQTGPIFDIDLPASSLNVTKSSRMLSSRAFLTSLARATAQVFSEIMASGRMCSSPDRSRLSRDRRRTRPAWRSSICPRRELETGLIRPARPKRRQRHRQRFLGPGPPARKRIRGVRCSDSSPLVSFPCSAGEALESWTPGLLILRSIRATGLITISSVSKNWLTMMPKSRLPTCVTRQRTKRGPHWNSGRPSGFVQSNERQETVAQAKHRRAARADNFCSPSLSG